MERKIGEEFNIRLRVVEDDYCDNCFFDEEYCNMTERNCSQHMREDGKNVIFVEVSEDV